jgi:hypothetical protein
MFTPDSLLYVMWYSVDSAGGPRYSIKYRTRLRGGWSGITALTTGSLPVRHASLAESHGENAVLAAWEDSSTGNMDVRFSGGYSGGGYPTSGRSTVPTACLGNDYGLLYSHLFWQEDSADTRDVCCHLYNGPNGWYARGTLRELCADSADKSYPNCTRQMLVWTEGAEPPYRVMWGEVLGMPGQSEIPTRGHGVLCLPSPMRDRLSILLPDEPDTVEIRDVMGRTVKAWSSPVRSAGDGLQWDGTDTHGRAVPAGVYVIRWSSAGRVKQSTVVKL